jgi:hypothetical protein
MKNGWNSKASAKLFGETKYFATGYFVKCVFTHPHPPSVIFSSNKNYKDSKFSCGDLP